MTPMFMQLVKQWVHLWLVSTQKLQLVGQFAVIGRKFKQISSAKLSNLQWFLLLYVAGTGCLLLLVTLLKVAMKLI